MEEAGIAPTGPLWVVGFFPQHVYGQDTYCVTYACACDDHVVTVSDEHTAYRWIDPIDYRKRYFSDEILTSLDDPRLRQLVTDIRDDLDRYIEWRSLAK